MKLPSLAVLALVAGCASCQPSPTPVQYQDAAPPVAPPLEAGDPCAQPGPTDLCQAAGENICRLQCRDVKTNEPLWKTPAGKYLAETCRRWTADGRDVLPGGGSRARCLANINMCQMIDEACR